MFDSISISLFFSMVSSFLLTDPSEMKLQPGHSHPVCTYYRQSFCYFLNVKLFVPVGLDALGWVYPCILQILLLQKSISEYCKKVFYYVFKLCYQYLFFMLLKTDYFWMQYSQFFFFLLQELSLKPLEKAMQMFLNL